MGFLNKLGIGGGNAREAARVSSNGHSEKKQHNGTLAVGAARTPEAQETTRVSNGLKEFMWNLEGLGRGTLLDLGPAWQTTLSFFIEKGFRVTSEDILRGWTEFLKEQESQAKDNLNADYYAERLPEARAKKFLGENLHYPAGSFDAVLIWDLLDYLEPTLAKSTVAHLTELLRPGGVVLALFHSKKPEGFQRYRVADTSTLQVLTAKTICPAQKVYQNREIQELFSRYRSVKSFIGRDQLRENLFIK
jgi:2-polyprenyl-3-methyl-5-hydroxy-6-metoxy-1,4-benzoquinol methylase